MAGQKREKNFENKIDFVDGTHEVTSLPAGGDRAVLAHHVVSGDALVGRGVVCVICGGVWEERERVSDQPTFLGAVTST